MPRFVKFLLFELLAIVIALGAHFCLLQFVAPILDLNELIEWIIATCASFVLYLVAGYLFNHLIVSLFLTFNIYNAPFAFAHTGD